MQRWVWGSSRAERISWPLFPASWQITSPIRYCQKQFLFLSCTAAGTWRISLDPTLLLFHLTWGMGSCRHHSNVISFLPLPELNWGNGRRIFLGCSLGLKELITAETFKFYAFQRVPHSFWKWDLSSLQTVFHRAWEPADELQEYGCLQTSSCSSQLAGRNFTQSFPGGEWREGLPAFSSLLAEVT